MPYEVTFGRPHTPPVAQEICGRKGDGEVQTTNSDSIEAAGDNTQDPPAKCEDLVESDCKAQTDFEIDTAKESEVELSKSVESIVLVIEEEDACPICLEGKLYSVHIWLIFQKDSSFDLLLLI